MKSKLVCVLIMISSNVISQNTLLPHKNGKVYYEKIYSIDGISKNVLYINSKKVFKVLFDTSNEELQIDDKENAIVSGNGSSFFRIPNRLFLKKKYQKIFFTVVIKAMDNKFKLSLFDFYVMPLSKNQNREPIECSYSFIVKTKDNYYTKVNTLFDKMVKSVIASISNQMNGNSSK